MDLKFVFRYYPHDELNKVILYRFEGYPLVKN